MRTAFMGLTSSIAHGLRHAISSNVVHATNFLSTNSAGRQCTYLPD